MKIVQTRYPCNIRKENSCPSTIAQNTPTEKEITKRPMGSSAVSLHEACRQRPTPPDQNDQDPTNLAAEKHLRFDALSQTSTVAQQAVSFGARQIHHLPSPKRGCYAGSAACMPHTLRRSSCHLDKTATATPGRSTGGQQPLVHGRTPASIAPQR